MTSRNPAGPAATKADCCCCCCCCCCRSSPLCSIAAPPTETASNHSQRQPRTLNPRGPILSNPAQCQAPAAAAAAAAAQSSSTATATATVAAAAAYEQGEECLQGRDGCIIGGSGFNKKRLSITKERINRMQQLLQQLQQLLQRRLQRVLAEGNIKRCWSSRVSSNCC